MLYVNNIFDISAIELAVPNTQPGKCFPKFVHYNAIIFVRPNAYTIINANSDLIFLGKNYYLKI